MADEIEHDIESEIVRDIYMLEVSYEVNPVPFNPQELRVLSTF